MALPDPGDVSQPKPIRFIASVVAAIGVIVGVLPLFGVPLTAEQIGGISAALAALGAIVTVAYAQPKVTPLASPRNDRGQPLVPAGPSRTEPEGYTGGTVLP